MKRLLPLACLSLWLSACAGSALPPTPVASPAPATLPSLPSVTFTSDTNTPNPPSTATPKPSPSSTPNCLEEGGQLESQELKDERLTRSLAFIVYLPPCYAQSPSVKYPVLYMLHGLAEDDHEWIDLGLTGSANRLIRAGAIPPFLIVMPWERTGLDMEIALTQALVPFVDEHYRTLPEPTSRGIGGLSRGGGWAFHIGMRHLDQFGVIGLHSPAPFGVDLAMVPRWVERQPGVAPPKIWIDIGDRDTLLSSTQQLTDLLDGMSQPYTFVLGSGWHNADYWSKNVGTYLRWYGSAW